jgi:hypothetical protein
MMSWDTKGAELSPAPISRVSSVYFPLVATPILICLGLDSSRFGKCTVKTPLLYSARIASGLTVLGKEKLRVNEP